MRTLEVFEGLPTPDLVMLERENDGYRVVSVTSSVAGLITVPPQATVFAQWWKFRAPGVDVLALLDSHNAASRSLADVIADGGPLLVGLRLGQHVEIFEHAGPFLARANISNLAEFPGGALRELAAQWGPTVTVGSREDLEARGDFAAPISKAALYLDSTLGRRLHEIDDLVELIRGLPEIVLEDSATEGLAWALGQIDTAVARSDPHRSGRLWAELMIRLPHLVGVADDEMQARLVEQITVWGERNPRLLEAIDQRFCALYRHSNMETRSWLRARDIRSPHVHVMRDLDTLLAVGDPQTEPWLRTRIPEWLTQERVSGGPLAETLAGVCATATPGFTVWLRSIIDESLNRDTTVAGQLVNGLARVLVSGDTETRSWALKRIGQAVDADPRFGDTVARRLPELTAVADSETMAWLQDVVTRSCATTPHLPGLINGLSGQLTPGLKPETCDWMEGLSRRFPPPPAISSRPRAGAGPTRMERWVARRTVG